MSNTWVNCLTMLIRIRYFTKGLKLDYPVHDTTKASRKYVKAMKTLPVSFSEGIHSTILILGQEIIPPQTTFNKQFIDLLRRIFQYDPKSRITAKQALKHPWFKETMSDDGTEAAKIRQKREVEARRQMERGSYNED